MPTKRMLLTLAALTTLSWQALAALPHPLERTMQVVVRVSGDDVRVSALRLLPGTAQRPRGNRPAGDLVFALETATGERLRSATADDPTRLRAEWTPDGRTIARSDVRLDAGEVALTFPYDQRAVRLRVSRPVAGDAAGKAADPEWKVALREVAVLDLGGLPSPGEYAKIADFDARTLISNGRPENRLDVVFLGDGYRQSDLGKYRDDVRGVIDYMFDVEPFKSFRSMVNVHAVDVISNESGIDDPAVGIRRDTALDLSFNIGGTQRCVYTNSPAKVFAAAANVPSYDYIFVIANDDQYGGCGGTFACFTTHTSATEIAVHELGHSFGLLADEYGSGDGLYHPVAGEPQAANATLASTRQELAAAGKWDYWIPNGQPIPTPAGRNGIGLFEGAVYTDLRAYRPLDTCRMRELFFDFCSVCVEQHVLRFHAFADPIDLFGPAPSDVIGGNRLVVSATDPAGDASGPADVLGVRAVLFADALAFAIDLAAQPPATSTALGGYRIALTAPGEPLRYVRIGFDRQARLTNENLNDVADLGGVYLVGTTMEVRVPLDLLGNPASLTWSLTATSGLGTPDTVQGSTFAIPNVANAILPLAPSEEVTLHAGLVEVSGASYTQRWLVDGVARGEGTSVTLTGASLGPGRHTVAFEVGGASSVVRRDLDGVLASRREVALLVGDVAGRPTASAGADLLADPGARVTLDGTASVGNGLAFTWRQIEGPRVTLDDPNAPRPSFEAPDRDARLVFQLVVADGVRLGLPDVVSVSVGDFPIVSGVTVKKNKKLVVSGSGYGNGAVIEVDGTAVADTKAAKARPDSRLSSRDALALAPAGRPVMIVVRNSDGVRSAPFAFTR
jgi:hypothetical protein